MSTTLDRVFALEKKQSSMEVKVYSMESKVDEIYTTQKTMHELLMKLSARFDISTTTKVSSTETNRGFDEDISGIGSKLHPNIVCSEERKEGVSEKG